jgi:hypothetical protein
VLRLREHPGFVDRLIDGKLFLVSIDDAARPSLALVAVRESPSRREIMRVDEY